MRWIKENRTDVKGCGAVVIGPAGENQVRFTAEDDHLPKRFTSEVLPETKKGITREQMAVLLREYYAARNWDENGAPKSEDGIQ